MANASGDGARMPLILLLIPSLAVLLSTIALVLAATGQSDLVRDDYYKAGLTVNRDLSATHLARRLGIRGTAEIAATHLRLRLHGTDANQLKVRLLHPVQADQDRSVTMFRVFSADDGEQSADYAGQLQTALANVHWTLRIEDEQAGWRYDHIARFPGSATLGPLK